MNKIQSALLLCSVPAALLAAIAPAHAAPPSCTPKIEAVPFGGDTKVAERIDKVGNGGTGEEFFVSCTGTAGAYKTLVQVRLPKAPQSGIVLVEPDQIHIYPKAGDYMSRAGHVDVVVVSSPRLMDSVKKANPARYGSLNLPAGPDSGHFEIGSHLYEAPTEFEVLSQVGAFIKAGGIPGIKPRKVILGGMSYFGGVVRNYIAYEHPRPGMKSVYDGYFPTQSQKLSYTAPTPDLDVPVMDLEGERELVVIPQAGAKSITYRRPDSALFRLYEVPGMPHNVTRGAAEGTGGAKCTGHTVSNFPNNAIYAAVMDKLVAWVDKGQTPARVPWISTSADGLTINRDTFGNALGGYRISYVDAPVATYHASWANYTTTASGPSDANALACDKVGWYAPLPDAQLKGLYASHDDYVAKVDKSLDESVAKGLLLKEDAQELRDEARQAKVP
jgi:hypothetical protein